MRDDDLFSRIDTENIGKLFLRDIELFFKPFLKRIVNKAPKQMMADYPEFETMCHNLSLEIFRRADVSKDGIIDR